MFPISRSLSTSRRRTDGLGYRLERPIHFECKLNELRRVFLKMPFRPCVSGCGRYLAPGDGHDRCLSCLGIEHAEAAFVDESCPHCGGMTVAGLRIRLRFLQRGGVPVPLLRSRVPPGGYRGEATSGSSLAGLTVTVRNSPSTARAPPVTSTSLPMELPRERAGPSHGGGGNACILWRFPRRSDVDRYIGG